LACAAAKSASGIHSCDHLTGLHDIVEIDENVRDSSGELQAGLNHKYRAHHPSRLDHSLYGPALDWNGDMELPHFFAIKEVPDRGGEHHQDQGPSKYFHQSPLPYL
jgi:hypothetical protein